MEGALLSPLMHLPYSYLKTLVTNLNSLAENFLDELRPLADGKTTVAMVDHIHGYTMDVLGKVTQLYCEIRCLVA